MAPQPRKLYQSYQEALIIYNELKELLDNNKIKVGQVYSYPTAYSFAISDTNITGIVNSLLASKSFGITIQSEPINGAATQWVINNNPSAPEYGSDYTNILQAYVDFVNLWFECLSIFTNKITPPKLGQKFSFYDKYQYAFDQGLDCNAVIEMLSGNNLVSLICTNQGSFHQIVNN